MKNPKIVKCPICLRERFVDYRHLWLIKNGKITTRCFYCSRPKKGQINAGCFKKGEKPYPFAGFKKGGVSWNKGISGYKTKPRSLEQRIKDSERQRGANGPGWKGGRRTINKILRQSLNFKLWREAIFKRDNYTCMLCESRGCELHPDHYPIQMALIVDRLIQEQGIGGIIEKAFKYAPLWDINNGRTLCAECHRLTPTYGKNIPCKSVNKSNSTVFV